MPDDRHHAHLLLVSTDHLTVAASAAETNRRSTAAACTRNGHRAVAAGRVSRYRLSHVVAGTTSASPRRTGPSARRAGFRLTERTFRQECSPRGT